MLDSKIKYFQPNADCMKINDFTTHILLASARFWQLRRKMRRRELALILKLYSYR